MKKLYLFVVWNYQIAYYIIFIVYTFVGNWGNIHLQIYIYYILLSAKQTYIQYILMLNVSQSVN